MRNPLSPIKRVVKKFTDDPVVLMYTIGLATGAGMVVLVQAGMPAKILTMTAEQAQFVLENPGKVIYFTNAFRDVAVAVAA